MIDSARRPILREDRMQASRMRSKGRTAVNGALIAFLIALPAAAGAAGAPILVDADWLEEHLTDPDVRIVEIGRDLYDNEAGHIPNAAFIDVGWISREVDGVPGMLASVETMEVLLETAGVSDGTTVVIYDASSSLWAARLFWALEYLGHEDVHVLNGGWMGWTCAGHEIEVGRPHMSVGDFTPKIREDVLATRDRVLHHLDDPGVTILDVRTPEEYGGDEALAAEGGHIPGAVHFEWNRALVRDGTGLIRPTDELEKLVYSTGLLPHHEAVTYCHVGARAAHTYLVLRVVGHERVRVYDGSWAEWELDPDLPVEPPLE